MDSSLDTHETPMDPVFFAYLSKRPGICAHTRKRCMVGAWCIRWEVWKIRGQLGRLDRTLQPCAIVRLFCGQGLAKVVSRVGAWTARCKVRYRVKTSGSSEGKGREMQGFEQKVQTNGWRLSPTKQGVCARVGRHERAWLIEADVLNPFLAALLIAVRSRTSDAMASDSCRLTAASPRCSSSRTSRSNGSARVGADGGEARRRPPRCRMRGIPSGLSSFRHEAHREARAVLEQPSRLIVVSRALPRRTLAIENSSRFQCRSESSMSLSSDPFGGRSTMGAIRYRVETSVFAVDRSGCPTV